MLQTTYIEVDLKQLKANLNTIKQFIPRHIKIIGVVKSDAYGHGLVEIAKTLQEHGCHMLGVGTADDVICLRSAGISMPILVIYPLSSRNFDAIIKANADITVTSQQGIRQAQKTAKTHRTTAKLHLQIDTGMHHYGCNPAEAATLAQLISNSPYSKLAGVSAHFSAASDIDSAKLQHETFIGALEKIAQANIHPASIHTANSSAVDRFPLSYTDARYASLFPDASIHIRPGCLLYGTYLANHRQLHTSHLITSMTSSIVEIKLVKAPDSVGYFNTFHATKDMKIALIPVGWASNGFFPSSGYVLINSQKANIVGPIGANTFAADISKIDASVDDTVTIIGQNGSLYISVDEFANMQKTFINRALALVCVSTVKIYRD